MADTPNQSVHRSKKKGHHTYWGPIASWVLFLVAMSGLGWTAANATNDTTKDVAVWRFYRAKPGTEVQLIALFKRADYELLVAQRRKHVLSSFEVFTSGRDTASDWTIAILLKYSGNSSTRADSSQSLIADVAKDNKSLELQLSAERQLIERQWDVTPKPLNDER